MSKVLKSITVSSGLVTAASGNTVDLADMTALSAASKLIGSGSTGGTVSEITLGTGLSMSGTTLTATGGGTYTGSNGINVTGTVISPVYGSVVNTICEGNDARLSDSRTPTGSAGGDLTGTYPNPTLTASGVTAATYGDSSHYPIVTVDAKGRLTTVTSQALPAGTIYTGSNGISVSGTVISPTYGTLVNTICQGNDSRLSDSRTPSGTAGGDLTGTYPNPTIISSVALSGTPTAATASAGTNTTQIATTQFVTNAVSVAVQGLQQKPTAAAATTAALPTCTYSNGTSGVGATLTASANGALTVDGYAVAVADRILVKNQATGANNGLYDVTQAGDASHPFILTRDGDMDQAAEFSGAFIAVGNLGTVNANSLWLCTNTASPTVGTTAITFTQLNGATDLSAGTGISISGNTISVSSAVALLASPAFTGTPTAPTAGAGTNTTQLATTAFVTSAVSTGTSGFAPLASPAFTGTPTAPTVSPLSDNTTKIATTAFVTNNIATCLVKTANLGDLSSASTARTNLGLGSLATQSGTFSGTSSGTNTGDQNLAPYALLASPTFTGTPAAPTPSAGDNSTKIATTAFIATSFAPLASPALTGSPTAPTQAAGDNSTKIATTAFVQGVAPQSGDIKITACPTLPSGWLDCDGTSYAKSTYPNLSSALVFTQSCTTTNGSATVTVADSTYMGVGTDVQGSGFNLSIASITNSTTIVLSGSPVTTTGTQTLTFAPYGSTSSTTFNVPDLRGRVPIGIGTGTSLTQRRMAESGGEETHLLTTAEMPAHTHTDPYAWAGAGYGQTSPISGNSINGTTGSVNSTGGGGSHNNMQPYCVVRYIIKV